MNLKLEFPSEKHKINYNKTRKKWWEYEDISKTSPWAFFNWNSFEEFLKITKKDVYESHWWVNAHLFFLILNDEIAWAIQVRHHIDHPNLIDAWWHIWYWIVPKFRKKWYATKMLELWLVEAKKIWLKKVLLTCDLDNIGSKKVIEKNWGVFERLTKNWSKKRFWIKL